MTKLQRGISIITSTKGAAVDSLVAEYMSQTVARDHSCRTPGTEELQSTTQVAKVGNSLGARVPQKAHVHLLFTAPCITAL